MAHLVSDRLGLVFTERDSDYLGTHHLARISDAKIKIQLNTIPGNEGEDEILAPDLAQRRGSHIRPVIKTS